MLVSVIIPTQSRTAMLREAVDSVLAQTVADLEIIIVANDATRGCLDVALELVRTGHPKIRLIERGSPGVSAAKNHGIRAAQGEWVSFLDDDDLWEPNKLAVQLEYAELSWAHMVGSRAGAFDHTGHLGEMKAELPAGLGLREALTIYNYLPGSSSGALVKRSVLLEVGGFDEELWAAEDWDLWRRIAHKHTIGVPRQPLVRYRIHDGSMTKSRWKVLRAEVAHLRKMRRDSPPDLRPMVYRARRAFVRRNLLHAYGRFNAKTFGIPGWFVLQFRRVFRRMKLLLPA